MVSPPLPNAGKYTKEYRRRQRWRRVVTAMAAVVVFCTTYALILPAITMERTCGLQEHTHDESCYVQITSVEVQEPSCTLDLHTHTAECYNGEGETVCGYADFAVHRHSDACYDASGQRWCTLPEIKAHTHDASCYSWPETPQIHQHDDDCYTYERGELICQEHVHSEACYTQTSNLLCPLGEGTGHSHDESCYDENEECVCGLEASEGHTHGEDCYGTVTELTCGYDGHEHVDTCYEWNRVLTCTLDTQPEPETEAPAEPVLICTEPEVVLHTHDDNCFDQWGSLICGKTQILEHRHGDSCFTTRQESVDTESLTCTDTSEEHTHGTLCYGTWKLICDIQEHTHTEECDPKTEETTVEETTAEEITYYCGLDAHTHGEDCHDAEGNLICTLEEHIHTDECLTEPAPVYYCGKEAHTHGEDCHDAEGNLTCTLEEHTHGDACLTEPAPVYYCGKEAHTHGEGCHDAEGNLTCALEEHTHGDACLTEPAPVYYCGKEAHTHGEDCYDAEGNLTCTLEEHIHEDACLTEPAPVYYCGKEAHTHGDDCYDAEGNLTCTLEEHIHEDACLTEPAPVYYCGKEAHTHGEDCYDAEGNLTCTLEEHTHTDECLTEPAPVYYCGKEAHTHGEDCYDAEGNLTCTLEEHIHEDACLTEPAPVYYCGKEAHTHGDDCYDAEGNLTCTLEEHTHTESCLEKFYYCGKEEHTHVATCFDAEGNLICTLEEHTHTEECWTPPTEEELRAIEAGFREELEALEALETLTEEDLTAAQDLLRRVEEAYRTRHLSEEAYTELFERIQALLVVELDGISEPCYGTNWEYLRDSGWFQAYSSAARSARTRTATSDVVTFTAETVDNTPPSAQQIDDAGGTNATDEVSVSKVIAGTDIENVFDITLTVETPQKIDEVIQEPDMAVVIVMDISNTMNDNFGGVTRYAAAVEAAEDFLDKFAESNSLGVSKIGYVAFNTDAHQIFGLQACTNEAQANVLKNTMRTETGNIINNYAKNAQGNVVDPKRFTNIEGGLKMASDMLSGASNQNKFIIFLSDGFPTTYIQDKYIGYDTYGKNFYDAVLGKYCLYGTSYSDTAAKRARVMAESIKASGTTIFSIGVDVGGQTIQDYIDDSTSDNAIKHNFSVVERTSESYDIGGAEDTGAYKNWLRNSIGSGYYYDSTNAAGLKAAYDAIFAEIKATVTASAEADWVASDPIPVLGENGVFDFIGLYDKDGALKESLTGEHKVSAENTASYASETITWDLKKSGYTTKTDGSTTLYTYTLKYRIRLKTEDTAFVEEQIYNTNGDTTLQYRAVTTVNGQTTVSASKTIDFPIPSVHGFLGELTFDKVDSYGRSVPGAEFTLTHAADCYKSHCRGDGETRVSIAPVTATSGEDGKVTFEKIPSGHTYILEETVIPDGYSTQGYSYTVTVAYDEVTVTVTDSGGNSVAWEDKIVNNTSYELPSTGGAGTCPSRLMGAALCLGAGVLLADRKKRRRP